MSVNAETAVFEDSTSAPVRVSCSVSCQVQSLMVLPLPTSIRYGATTPVVGLATPASTTDAAVSTLIVEPGSYGTANAREPSASIGASLTLLGSTVGQSATAMSAPSFTRMTTAVAHVAPRSRA